MASLPLLHFLSYTNIATKGSTSKSDTNCNLKKLDPFNNDSYFEFFLDHQKTISEHFRKRAENLGKLCCIFHIEISLTLMLATCVLQG